MAVLWEVNQISHFRRLTQSLIFNEWLSENGSGDENEIFVTKDKIATSPRASVYMEKFSSW
jgi:hypothetical protein